MSRASCAGVALTWLVGSASLVAAAVWESKPFHTWTDKELKKVLTSSPWAGKASITYVRSGGGPIEEEAIVTWASSRVMRQALARAELGNTPDIPLGTEALLAQTPPYYVVTVEISKGPVSAARANQAAAMQNETFLRLRGKPPIPAVQAEGQIMGPDGTLVPAPDQPVGAPPPGGGRFAPRSAPLPGASLVVFRFPRDPITLADKDVEFVSKLCSGTAAASASEPPSLIAGGLDPDVLLSAAAARRQTPACYLNVKKTFKLKDMVVNGELSL